MHACTHAHDTRALPALAGQGCMYVTHVRHATHVRSEAAPHVQHTTGLYVGAPGCMLTPKATRTQQSP
eukprot:363811-Chlamydomonas_euryale.AAC.17